MDRTTERKIKYYIYVHEEFKFKWIHYNVNFTYYSKFIFASPFGAK